MNMEITGGDYFTGLEYESYFGLNDFQKRNT